MKSKKVTKPSGKSLPKNTPETKKSPTKLSNTAPTEITKPKHSGKRNRTAGHNYERQIIKELKELWPERFGNAKSTRSESKNLDDKGVDIMDAKGYHFQCKNTCTPINYAELLERMPKAGPIVNVIMHKKTKKCNTKFLPVGEYAILTKSDFYKLIQRIQAMTAVADPFIFPENEGRE